MWSRHFGLLMRGPSCHTDPNLPGPQITAESTDDAAHAVCCQVDRKPHTACRDIPCMNFLIGWWVAILRLSSAEHGDFMSWSVCAV